MTRDEIYDINWRITFVLAVLSAMGIDRHWPDMLIIGICAALVPCWIRMLYWHMTGWVDKAVTTYVWTSEGLLDETTGEIWPSAVSEDIWLINAL